MDNQSITKDWLRDSVIAFPLIVTGILLSRPLAGWLQIHGSLGYVSCCVIAEIPFLCFLGIRRGFFLWWEYLGFIACLVAMAVARDRAIQLGTDNLLVASIAPGIILGCFFRLHQAVRSHWLAPHSNDSVRSV